MLLYLHRNFFYFQNVSFLFYGIPKANTLKRLYKMMWKLFSSNIFSTEGFMVENHEIARGNSKKVFRKYFTQCVLYIMMQKCNQPSTRHNVLQLNHFQNGRRKYKVPKKIINVCQKLIRAS